MLEVIDLSVRFGGVQALRDVNLMVPEGGVCALIGPNGAGKTTLFNVISRVYEPASGKVLFGGHDLLGRARHEIIRLGIARTFQNLALWPTLSVRENVMLGAHITGTAGVLRAALRWRTKSEELRLTGAANAVMSRVGIYNVADRPATGLPFGTLKRVELARALMADPRLLLLDEPAGGLTHAEVDALAELIRNLADDSGLTVLLVEHHMGMVMRLAQQVAVLESGTVIATGPPDEVRADPQVIAAYLGSAA
jgi:branched-chain amino acid transport system ATP-binding protein